MRYCPQCRIGTLDQQGLCVLCGAPEQPSTGWRRVAERGAAAAVGVFNPAVPAAALPPLTRIEGNLPPEQHFGPNERVLIISRDQSWLTHGFHKYPVKFFPELPRWAIHRYSEPGQTVLDPMAGSGTVNVECLLA